MKPSHKTMRAALRSMPKQQAKELLESSLPEREYKAVYFADALQMDLNRVADALHCSESTVKKVRQNAYRKLTDQP